MFFLYIAFLWSLTPLRLSMENKASIYLSIYLSQET